MEDLAEPPATAPRRLRTAAIGLICALAGAASMVLAVPGIRAATEQFVGITTVTPSTDHHNVAVAVERTLGPSVVLVTARTSTVGFYGATQTDWGSGVIFSSGGYIVTNNHVIEGSQNVTVTLSSGQTVHARVVGTDPSTDLAVLQIVPPTGATLVPATFANSNDVVTGQTAIAIGNPLGPQYEGTLTVGVVGAIRPMLYGDTNATPRVTDMIQTDASINPGNSGGPLANAQGQVIGIITMKVAQTGESQVPAAGLGFAIPSDVVRDVVNQILEFGYVKRAYLGLTINANDTGALPDQSETLAVYSVDAGGPAAQAGIEPGDVLTSWNGQSIRNYYQLIEDLNGASPGQSVQIGVQRNGIDQTVTIVLGLEPAALDTQTSAPTTASSGLLIPGLLPLP